MSNEKSSAAQNKMGELFVDIGSSGIPKLVKGLNSVSASFLLAKKGAEEFTRPVREMMKNASSDAMQWAKLSAQLGGTTRQIQSLSAYFKVKKFGNGISDIAKLQSQIYDIQNGFSAMPADMATAFNLMGIDIMDYNSSLESTLKLIEDIRKKTKDLGYDAQTTQSRLRQMGLSGEWAYVFDRPDFQLAQSLTLSQKEIDDILKADEATEEAKTAVDQLINKIFAKAAPTITKTINGYSSAISKEVPSKNSINKKDAIKNTGIGATAGFASGAGIGAGAGTMFGPVGTAIGAGIGALLGGTIGSISGAAYTLGKSKKDKGSNDWSLTPKEQPSKQMKPTLIQDEKVEKIELIPNEVPKEYTGGAAPIDYSLSDFSQYDEIPALKNSSPLDALPSSVQKTMTNNINVTINNENNIQTPDAQGSARAISQIDEQQMSLSAQQAINQMYAL